MNSSLSGLVEIYQGSDGEATRALYARLEALGPAGAIAVNLLRASKTSTRAKRYRGGRFRRGAYGTKAWSIDNLDQLLLEHGEALGLRWGWGVDDREPVHRFVLYVDLPIGQVSFHTDARGQGPTYAGAWDGAIGLAGQRILAWAAALLDGRTPAPGDVPIGDKVAYVKSEGQTRDHTCHWPGCSAQVPPAVWGCRPHWYALPKPIRDRIFRAFQPDQEKTGRPSAEYVAAARAARDWILQQQAAERQGQLL